MIGSEPHHVQAVLFIRLRKQFSVSVHVSSPVPLPAMVNRAGEPILGANCACVLQLSLCEECFKRSLAVWTTMHHLVRSRGIKVRVVFQSSLRHGDFNHFAIGADQSLILGLIRRTTRQAQSKSQSSGGDEMQFVELFHNFSVSFVGLCVRCRLTCLCRNVSRND